MGQYWPYLGDHHKSTIVLHIDVVVEVATLSGYARKWINIPRNRKMLKNACQ